MTREEAVQKIVQLEDRIDLVVQNRIMEYRRILISTGADSGGYAGLSLSPLSNDPNCNNMIGSLFLYLR